MLLQINQLFALLKQTLRDKTGRTSLNPNFGNETAYTLLQRLDSLESWNDPSPTEILKFYKEESKQTK